MKSKQRGMSDTNMYLLGQAIDYLLTMNGSYVETIDVANYCGVLPKDIRTVFVWYRRGSMEHKLERRKLSPRVVEWRIVRGVVQEDKTIWDGENAPTRENIEAEEPTHRHDEAMASMGAIVAECDLYRTTLIGIRDSINNVLGE